LFTIKKTYRKLYVEIIKNAVVTKKSLNKALYQSQRHF